MLVIGFCGNIAGGDVIASASFDVDLKTDSPRKVHDTLSAMKEMHFEHITLVDNDNVVATYSDGEDYDLTETVEDDEESYTDMFEDDPSGNDDNLFDDANEEELEDVE